MNILCPHCGTIVEFVPDESEICPECGSELRPCESTAEKQPFPDANLNVLLSRVDDIDQKIDCTEKKIDNALSAHSWSQESGSNCHRQSSSVDNPYLEIEYNRNLFFVSGSSSVIRLRITPKSDLLRGLILFMETHGINSERIRCEIPVTESLQKNISIEARKSFCPKEMSGRMALDFYIGCMLETSPIYYHFSTDHKIYDPKLSTTSIAQQIIINQDIKASEAGDVNVRDSIGDAIRNLSEKSPSVYELIDRLNDLPPLFVRQELLNTNWRPETMIVQGNPYPNDKLMLEWNDRRLLLLGKRHVKLGRSRELCDLIIQTKGNGKIGALDYPNNTVSRIHAELLYNGDNVQLFDKSTYGTFINGRRPDGAGFPMPNDATIEFGDIHWKMSQQFCVKSQATTICQACTASRIKSMVFTRKDREPENYLVIWQCCELGMIFAELADWIVYYRDNAFFIRTPEQKYHYLRPGGCFCVNKQTIRVSYYPSN